MEHTYRVGDRVETVRVTRTGDTVAVTVGDRTYTARVTTCAGGRLGFILDGRSVDAAYARADARLDLWLEGETHHLATAGGDADSWGGGSSATASDGRVLTPMPGKVVAVHVERGDEVTAGQALVVLESMKMQNDIVAPAAGRVKAVHHAAGDSVEYGDVLVELDLSAADDA